MRTSSSLPCSTPRSPRPSPPQSEEQNDSPHDVLLLPRFAPPSNNAAGTRKEIHPTNEIHRMSQRTTLGDFRATTIDGKDQDLGIYVGDVVLVVNTASQCGLTPQYEGLQRLYDTYAGRG